jgi:hypothetical protein
LRKRTKELTDERDDGWNEYWTWMGYSAGGDGEQLGWGIGWRR